MARRERKSLLETLLSRLRKEPEPKARVASPPRPFQAISIYRGTQACTPAKRFSDYRFLAKDAPQLPLPGCTMPDKCECKYLKHKDRRVDSRRLADFGATRRGFIGQERRDRFGRRSTD